MLLKKEYINEFKILYKQEFDEELNDIEAREYLNQILTLVKLVANSKK